MALASIAVVTALQHRASSSRDAQVALGQIAVDFDALQSVPYNGIDSNTHAAHALVLERMQAREHQIVRSLAALRRGSSTPHLTRVAAPYRANTAVLERIRVLIIRGQQPKADELGSAAGRLQHEVDQQLSSAGAEYQQRASKALTLSTLGSAFAILALLALFGVFYLRSRKAHATAEILAQENASFLVRDSQLQVIQRLALAAEYRDDDTGQHTRRVGNLSARIGAALGMPAEQLLLLRQAAPLHDVGKIGVPDSILLKPGRLTPDEFEQMKAHATLGGGMLAGGRGLPLLEMAEEIALTHHERWDGSGYPAGLSGRAIPLVGRIVGVADVFDALTHSRPYKEAWSVAAAVTEIRDQAGRLFDPEVVDAFMRVLPDLVSSPDDEHLAAIEAPGAGESTVGEAQPSRRESAAAARRFGPDRPRLIAAPSV
jgi:HD-GYP domain-containing protein (c-di-GMP phosphodiesterase class II)